MSITMKNQVLALSFGLLTAITFGQKKTIKSCRESTKKKVSIQLHWTQ